MSGVLWPKKVVEIENPKFDLKKYVTVLNSSPGKLYTSKRGKAL